MDGKPLSGQNMARHGFLLAKEIILSQYLFNLYTDYIKTGLDTKKGGLKIEERNINNLRNTDNTILLTE